MALEDNSVFLDVNLTILTLNIPGKWPSLLPGNPLCTWLVSSSLYLLNELLIPSLLFKLPTTSSKQIFHFPVLKREKAMAPHSSTLAWKIPWTESLVGCSPWGRWESDTTEWLHFQFSLLCIGEENGNPLQCSCLENPRGWGAWWAAVYGMAQSRTQLKWLSISSSRAKDSD